jgi:tetratricopeptide (TPR) repeat protein
LAQIEKDDALELAALERLCDFRPADTSLRFQLGYKHSQSDNPDMAFLHYMKIPVLGRNAITWNNLGVSYAHFHMPVKSINAFKRSEEDGETLAMSNIGTKLLNSGFLEEAQERATKALQIQNYHANINDLLKRLREARGGNEEGNRGLREGEREGGILSDVGSCRSLCASDRNGRCVEDRGGGVESKPERDISALLGIA